MHAAHPKTKEIIRWSCEISWGSPVITSKCCYRARSAKTPPRLQAPGTSQAIGIHIWNCLTNIRIILYLVHRRSLTRFTHNLTRVFHVHVCKCDRDGYVQGQASAYLHGINDSSCEKREYRTIDWFLGMQIVLASTVLYRYVETLILFVNIPSRMLYFSFQTVCSYGISATLIRNAREPRGPCMVQVQSAWVQIYYI